MNIKWPFADARNTAVFTTREVLEGGMPILRVTHDDDDGAWQFQSGEVVSEHNAMVIALEEIVEHDSTVLTLADLPLGWIATRRSVDDEWKRQETN